MREAGPTPPLPSSPDAHALRRDARLVGAMLGSLAGFKQQNSMCGLPLRLLREEVAVAWEEGEGEVEGPAALAPAAPAAHAPPSSPGWIELYTLPCEPGAADPFPGCAADPAATPTAETPYTPAVAAPASARVPAGAPTVLDLDSEAGASLAVFRDLRQRGYHLTPGHNFGADWLAYPADPLLYHAQLCVRVCGPGGTAPECGVLLAAATRGAHAARKHLLLAWPAGGAAGCTT